MLSVLGKRGTPQEVAKQLDKLYDGFISDFGQAIQVAKTTDPSQSTLAILYSLSAWSHGDNHNNEQDQFIVLTSNFLKSCTEDIRLAPKHFVKVCRTYTFILCKQNRPQVGILPMKSAIKISQPYEDILTPQHSFYLQLCIASQNYAAAREFYNPILLSIQPALTALTCTDLSTYTLYATTALACDRKYAAACAMAEMGLSIQSMVHSKVILTLYKRYVLLCMIHDDHFTRFPRCIPQEQGNKWQHHASTYEILTKMMTSTTSTYAQIQRQVQQCLREIQQDGNGGLVQLALDAWLERRVKECSVIFQTVHLSEFAAQVGVQDTQQLQQIVLKLLWQGKLSGGIDPEAGLLHFWDGNNNNNSSGTGGMGGPPPAPAGGASGATTGADHDPHSEDVLEKVEGATARVATLNIKLQESYEQVCANMDYHTRQQLEDSGSKPMDIADQQERVSQ